MMNFVTVSRVPYLECMITAEQEVVFHHIYDLIVLTFLFVCAVESATDVDVTDRE